MAFTVTPTSGDAPYVYNVSFENAGNFGSEYSFEYANVMNVGECATDYTLGTNLPATAATLLATGTSSSGTSVPSGSCRSAFARIRRLSDNVVISGSIANIDNV